ncbi:MAG: hypothetical protein LBB44_01415 [Endomicrobium sp.]|jgi:hypothetical protein|nr:hypothetical protein [Endomicrobium sp.]
MHNRCYPARDTCERAKKEADKTHAEWLCRDVDIICDTANEICHDGTLDRTCSEKDAAADAAEAICNEEKGL